jgi:RHS repeat-associated protein
VSYFLMVRLAPDSARVFSCANYYDESCCHNAVKLKKVTVKVKYLDQEQISVTLCDSLEDRYRFGFNGMEKDNELKGIGNSLDFGARIYDSRLGRWLSLDPLAAKYPSLSSYNFVANSPLTFIDPDGKDYRLAIIKNDNGKILSVSAHATVYLQGKGASQEMADKLNKEFSDKYSGYRKVNGVNVAFFVDYVYDGDNTKKEENLRNGQNIFNVRTDLEEDYRSEVFGKGNRNRTKFYTGNTGIINIKSRNLTKTIVHETLHLMGLSDRYDNFDNNLYRGIDVHTGFDKDIMGGGDKISDVHYENLLNHAKAKTGTFIDQDNELYDRASKTDLKNGSKPNTQYHEMSTQVQGD